jgi:hypothetical protein
MLARARGLQLAPQFQRTPAVVGNAADEFVNEGQLSLQQRKPELGLRDHRGRALLYLPVRSHNSPRAPGASVVALSFWASLPPGLKRRLSRVHPGV